MTIYNFHLWREPYVHQVPAEAEYIACTAFDETRLDGVLMAIDLSAYAYLFVWAEADGLVAWGYTGNQIAPFLAHRLERVYPPLKERA